jgi:hypothetical protein
VNLASHESELDLSGANCSPHDLSLRIIKRLSLYDFWFHAGDYEEWDLLGSYDMWLL